MIFLWSSRNEEHIDEHNVTREEAEHVIRGIQPPDPQLLGDEKRGVWGQTPVGRYLQVIYVYVQLENVEPDEYLRLELRSELLWRKAKSQFALFTLAI